MPFIALCQVFGTFRIAKRHVRALIDKLSRNLGFGNFLPIDINERESTARDSDPHASDLVKRTFGRQIRHARRRLALAVHDNEILPLALRVFRELLVKCRQYLPPCLRHRPKTRQFAAKEHQLVQHLIGVRDTAKTCRTLLCEKVPELPLHDALLGKQDGRTDGKM